MSYDEIKTKAKELAEAIKQDILGKVEPKKRTRKIMSKLKKSVYFGIVADCDCRAVAMCNLFYDHTSKPRVGHLKTDRYQEFDYDEFIGKGYAYTDTGNLVLKDDGKVLVTAFNLLGLQGYSKFIASIIRNTDMEAAMEAAMELTGGLDHELIGLARTSMYRTKRKLCHAELEHNGMLRIDRFVLAKPSGEDQ